MTMLPDQRSKPPDVEPDEDGDGDPCVLVHAGIAEADGNCRHVTDTLPADADDDQVADVIVRVVLAVSAMRSRRLLAAVLMRMKRELET